ncbi:MAG: hypothetical protein MZW92_65360 [Comamonadaceae bacterium]|nr:hypothetical protein [Comamonadaceae bacterium]
MLEDTTKTQTFYRLREKSVDGAMIVKVQREKVTIRQADGVAVELQVADDTKIVSVPPPRARACAGCPKASSWSTRAW